MPRLLRVYYPPKVKRGGQRCIGCHRPIVYGDRCPPCQQRLRQRKRRKPR